MPYQMYVRYHKLRVKWIQIITDVTISYNLQESEIICSCVVFDLYFTVHSLPGLITTEHSLDEVHHWHDSLSIGYKA